MKTLHFRLKVGPLLIWLLAVSGFSSDVVAQTSDLIPMVTVQATQPVATITNSGVFTVFRAGDTNAALNVWYNLGGTASNGLDYAMIAPHLVEIAAGTTSNTLFITPLTNSPSSALAKSVTVTLTNSPLRTPVNYNIGSPSRATVWIANTNFPPVAIVNPKAGTVFYTPTNLQMVAATSYPFDPANVEFFAGTNDLGRGIPYLSAGLFGTLYELTWTNPPPGNYAVTAIATDKGGVFATSAPVNLTVLQGPPPTNLPPDVSLIQPTNGAVFYTATNVLILAKASDPDGLVTNVQFFAAGGAIDIGSGTPVVLDPPGINGVTGLVYFFNWRNPPAAGTFPLTAVATDNDGLSTTSAPVDISVFQGPRVVDIYRPTNGATFFAPVDIRISATASASNGVASVKFFDNNQDLGPGILYGCVTNPPLIPICIYSLVWSNASVGSHVLTAVLTDNTGAFSTSLPVNITVLPSLPPPTNRPPLVSIVATDPVAIEGTNAWVWPGETNWPPTWAHWPPRPVFFFTNCGPRTATFTVNRRGDTNETLTVNYHLGGTASNGVDYLALSGAVKIPAGERRALITIVPIDDGPPDVNKTVIVTLLPDMLMNPLPGYLLGFPRRAAALIIDHGPSPATGMLPGGYFHLAEPGPDATWYCIESSTDLVNWNALCTNQVINGSIDFIDPDAATNSSRYYRVVPLTNTPSE